jgi:hypothetical protein
MCGSLVNYGPFLEEHISVFITTVTNGTKYLNPLYFPHYVQEVRKKTNEFGYRQIAVRALH